MRNRLVAAATAAGTLLAAAPPAQTWQTLTAQRQHESLDSLAVRVHYGVGKLSIAAATQSLLYDVRWRYNADEFRPTHRYDAATHTLSVGSAGGGDEHFFSFSRHRARSDHDAELSNELALGVPRGVPLDLALTLGATEANVDLSDLWLSRLRAEAGASDAQFTFGTRNARPMRSLDLKLGAASLTAAKLGNARAERIQVTTGAGSADLDFGGTWESDASLQLDVVMGGVTLRVPRDLGVRLRATKILADVDAPRTTQRDGAYVSDNWESAAHKLTIGANVTLGHVELVWSEP